MPLAVTHERVLGFLRSLRDSGVAAWQRLQAARAVEWYQALVLRSAEVDFSLFKQKLGELAEVERRAGGEAIGKGMPGEGLPGEIDADEPESVRAMRVRMRVLHHPKSTETAYVGWVKRFIRHVDDERLERYGEQEIGDFLSDLAVVGEVSSGTQSQALAAPRSRKHFRRSDEVRFGQDLDHQAGDAAYTAAFLCDAFT